MDDVQQQNETGSGELAESRAGSRVWLLGAYTFLVLWAATFLVLYFTDRLPI